MSNLLGEDDFDDGNKTLLFTIEGTKLGVKGRVRDSLE